MLDKFDIKDLIKHYFKEQAAQQPPVIMHTPMDLTPIADAIREGLQSIANSLEYAAQVKYPNVDVATSLYKKLDDLDAVQKP